MMQLAWPWMFLILPLPFLLRRYWRAQPQQLGPALVVPYYQSILDSQYKSHRSSPHARLILLTLIWLLLILAAAGPQWVGPPERVKRQGRNIMMALDISGSMQLDDMNKNGYRLTRLEAVKDTARAFIKHRKDDKLGLILFGSRAYLQTPLTFDHQTLLSLLNDATVGLAGQMTAIGDSIGLAIKRLKKVPAKSRVLILLTDGVNNAGVLEPLKAAELARDNGIRVYTIGLKAPDYGGFVGRSLLQPSNDLDDKSLRQIAKITGGQFFIAQDLSQLTAVYQTIDQLEAVKSKGQSYRPIKEYYYYPLLVAMVLSWMLLIPNLWHRSLFAREELA